MKVKHYIRNILIVLLSIIILVPNVTIDAKSSKVKLAHKYISLTIFKDGSKSFYGVSSFLKNYKSSTMTITTSINKKGKKVIKIQNDTICPLKKGTAKLTITVRSKKTEKVLLSKTVKVQVFKEGEEKITPTPTQVPITTPIPTPEPIDPNTYIYLTDDFGEQVRIIESEWLTFQNNEQIGVEYIKSGLYSQALSYFKVDADFVTKYNLNKTFTSTFNNLALCYTETNNLAEGERYYLKAAEYGQPLYSNLADLYMRLENKEKAIYYAQLYGSDSFLQSIKSHFEETPINLNSDYSEEYPGGNVLWYHSDGTIFKITRHNNSLFTYSWYDHTSKNPIMWSNSTIPGVTGGAIDEYDIYIYYNNNGYPNKTELVYNGITYVTTTFESNSDGSCKKAYWYTNDGKTYVFTSIEDKGTLVNNNITPEPPTITPEPPTITPEPVITQGPTQSPTQSPTNEPSNKYSIESLNSAPAFSLRDSYWIDVLKNKPYTPGDPYWEAVIAKYPTNSELKLMVNSYGQDDDDDEDSNG